MQFLAGDRVIKAIERGSPFFSFIIGLGISVLLFHRNYASIKMPALPLKEMVDKVVRVDGKCYKYRVEDSRCETSSST
jgi:hypothetical protein